MKVVDVELGAPLVDVSGLDGYAALRALIRLHGAPIGSLDVPVADDRCAAEAIRNAAIDRLAEPIARHLLRDLLEAPSPPGGWRLADLLAAPHPPWTGPLPRVTVAVCTRDRTPDLRVCLDALTQLEYPELDLLVVDNAPRTDATQRLVTSTYPRVRYVREPRPGLNWARNRAIVEGRGEIIAYTDDDVVVDPEWVTALAQRFQDPEVMAVTGLVMPFELETEAQLFFEQYGGFGRGFIPRWYRIGPPASGRSLAYLGAGRFGTGANMAFRRTVFERVGAFDPALDVGTITNGGGDLEMFFRVLKEGYILVYEPGAVVRHRHRRGYAQLRTQLANNGVGFYSFLVRTARVYSDERLACLRFGSWWFWWWNVRRLLFSLVGPTRFPRDLILAEIRGSLVGLTRYRKAQRTAAEITRLFGPFADLLPLPSPNPPRSRKVTSDAIAVRTVDVGRPLQPMENLKGYAGIRLFVLCHDRPVGKVDIDSLQETLGVPRIRDAIAANLGLESLVRDVGTQEDVAASRIRAGLRSAFGSGPTGIAGTDDAPGGGEAMGYARLSDDVAVSVVVATYDRPDDLRACLGCLVAQETSRPVEIIVVDNHPNSGLTPPVVDEFPGVVVVAEWRQGLSYARNEGIAASTGEIVVMTDDDVTMPSDWLERLVAPFARPEVMAVTGNTLPLQLDTAAQRWFEVYGGLSRGFKPLEVGAAWFRSFRWGAVSTWHLGATANAAFRATIFRHPDIGLLDEALGAGSPTACSEDTYLFYKVLKAGYTIVYEPGAYAWHRHRRDMRALRRQLYGYSKGHVAHLLTTLVQDRDPRGLDRLAFRIPNYHARRIARQTTRLVLRRDPYFPMRLILAEIAGNLAGPWAWWRSRRRVRRLGRSRPYIPAPERCAAPSSTLRGPT